MLTVSTVSPPFTFLNVQPGCSLIIPKVATAKVNHDHPVAKSDTQIFINLSILVFSQHLAHYTTSFFLSFPAIGQQSIPLSRLSCNLCGCSFSVACIFTSCPWVGLILPGFNSLPSGWPGALSPLSLVTHVAEEPKPTSDSWQSTSYSWNSVL